MSHIYRHELCRIHSSLHIQKLCSSKQHGSFTVSNCTVVQRAIRGYVAYNELCWRGKKNVEQGERGERTEGVGISR